MAIDTITIAQFIKDQRITLTADRTDFNPNMADSDNMDHWKVVLRRPGHTLTTYFSMGYGHNGKAPTAADVLYCLASDSSTIDNVRDFEDFCADLGYDSDSRKAEKIYKACQHAAKRLRNFIGDQYETLVYNTERL